MSITALLPPPSPTGYLSPDFTFFPLAKEINSNSNSTTKSKQQKQSNRNRRDSSSSSGSVSSNSSSGSSSSGSSSSEDSYDSVLEDQLQWEESMRQLQLIFSIVALPYFAKWAGRKWAYWSK